MPTPAEDLLDGVVRHHVSQLDRYLAPVLIQVPQTLKRKRMLLVNTAQGGVFFWLEQQHLGHEVWWIPPGERRRQPFAEGDITAESLELFQAAVPMPASTLFSVVAKGITVELIYSTHVVLVSGSKNDRPQIGSYVLRGASPLLGLVDSRGVPQPNAWWQAVRTGRLRPFRFQGPVRAGYTPTNVRCFILGEGAEAGFYAPPSFWATDPKPFRLVRPFHLTAGDAWERGH